MKHKQNKLTKKGGISFAWDSLGIIVLVLIVLVVVIFMIVNFAKSGNGFLETLGNIF